MPSDDDHMLHSQLLADDALDTEFDELLPPVAKARSREYWTPVSVARRAAARFAERGVRRVLDVGSGPGKFCIVAASAQPELEFRGIEQREQLVESANDLAQRLHVRNSEFSVGDALAASWRSFDGLYFFNPFAENSYASWDVFDRTVELSQARLASELIRTARLLSSVPIGTVVITYNGLNGPIPSSYDLVSQDPVRATCLRTWVKARCCEGSWYHLETGGSVTRVAQDYWDRKLRARLVHVGSG